MRKFIITLSLIIVAALQIQAQGNFAIHLDKPFYATGEEIWYKLYLPTNLTKSVAIKTIIINADGQTKERFFLRSEPGKSYVDGQFKIPFSYTSGMHRIEFRASAGASDPDVVLAQMEFPIYNDFEIKSLAAKKSDNSSAGNQKASTLNGLNIDIALDKNSFSKREQVNATITVKDAAGNPVQANYSVVARDVELIEEALPNAPNYALGQSFNQTQLNQFSEKIFVKGQVMDSLGQAMQANVLGAYASLQKRIHYGKTDGAGIFTFGLPDFYEDQTLQFIGYPKESEEIKVKLFKENTYEDRPKQALLINDKILKYLELSQQKKKMAEYFEHMSENIEKDDIENTFEGLKADFSYIADDYVKFEDIGSFFSELITPLKFRIVNKVYSARMENPRSRDASYNNLPGKPIFIIDGKVTRDANFIARTSWSNVRTVDIFYVAEKLRKQFNILGQGGVVRITTDIPQYTLPPNDLEDVFEVNGLQAPASFVPYLPSKSSAEVRLPNFRMPNYWLANAQTSNNGQADVSFYQGDEKSTFVIEVIAQSADGKLGRATKTYTVQ
ncbi:MAG: hypothetical protein Sapg2KO_33290 [Saprospiraceae bacterium]